MYSLFKGLVMCSTVYTSYSVTNKGVCVCVACAVSALLCEMAGCGGGEMEFDVALGQEELTEKSLQLAHLLPAGYIPVSHTISSRSIGIHHANVHSFM